MGSSLATRIREANAALLGTGDLEAVADYFTSDYVAHVTEKDMTGGHAFVAKVEFRRAGQGDGGDGEGEGEDDREPGDERGPGGGGHPRPA